MAQDSAQMLATDLLRVSQAIHDTLEELLPRPQGAEAVLIEAMRYAALSRTRFFRGYLVVRSGALFGVDERSMLRVAAALECLYSHARVHDDLPIMEHGSVRGERPATHLAFDDPTALLAGTALLAHAFTLISSERTCPDPFIRGNLTAALCEAAGHGGLAGGQMIDLALQGRESDVGTLTRMQRMKTGSLIAFACTSGAIMGRAGQDLHHALEGYAHDLSLAFQIMDDLKALPVWAGGVKTPPISAVSAPSASGSSGPDSDETVTAKPDRPGLASVLGPERARGQADLLARQAISHLDVFDGKADPLRHVAQFVVDPAS